MHSYRAEVFEILTAFLFFDEYCQYYMLTNHSKVTYYEDNLEVVTKLKDIQSNPHYYDEYIKLPTMMLSNFWIFTSLPSITIHLARNDQDKVKKQHQLTTAELLNIKVDKIIEAKAQKPINIHLKTSIAIYINNTYYPNKHSIAIRPHRVNMKT